MTRTYTDYTFLGWIRLQNAKRHAYPFASLYNDANLRKKGCIILKKLGLKGKYLSEGYLKHGMLW